jgi:hypothetical protein
VTLDIASARFEFTSPTQGLLLRSLIVFLNISEQSHQVAFGLQGAQYGFKPETDLAVAVLGLDRDENPVREVYGTFSGGSGRIEHTLEPRGMWALEVGPINSHQE